MSFKFNVIKGSAPTDSDYEMVFNMAVNNTLKPYWDWANECGVEDLTFEILTEQNELSYGNEMKVFACFENEQNYNDFVLQNTWTCPKTKMVSDQQGNMIYE